MLFLAVVCLTTQFGLQSAAPIKIDVSFKLKVVGQSVLFTLHITSKREEEIIAPSYPPVG